MQTPKYTFHSYRAYLRFLKGVKRRKRFARLKSGFERHVHNVKLNAIRKGRDFIRPEFISPRERKHRNTIRKLVTPQLPPNIQFWASLENVFSSEKFSKYDDGYFYIPQCFSLLERHEESFNFLKRLFSVLYGGKTKRIILDYSQCERIDADASICMDVILAEFIKHINKCRRKGLTEYLEYDIQPVNYDRPDIMKVLFSIGAYRNLRGLEIRFSDVESLPVLVGYRQQDRGELCEIHATKIVEYIKKCLSRMQRELTTEAEDSMYKVIGEVMTNAEDHGTMPHRYAVGYFQEIDDADGHFGIFNFCVFNFGDSIYKTFKNPNCPQKVSEQMAELSQTYTRRGLFRSAEFEEETLWTLYALQDGVTSKPKKRGNGSIQFIENFFKLKGDLDHDNISRLVIVSGNTRIMFDGKYQIAQKPSPDGKRKYKVITFNDSGEIGDQPDKNYVTFAPQYFPGTLISARILINFNNTNTEQDVIQSGNN